MPERALRMAPTQGAGAGAGVGRGKEGTASSPTSRPGRKAEETVRMAGRA